MVQVASIDYANKRIYLAFDTVINGVDPVEAYKEVRALRRTTESDRRYSPLIAAQGNEPKGGGKFTPRRAVLLDGARFVPYDTSHTLMILTEVITDDERSGADAFDRLPLSSGVEVNIDIGFQQVEIITISTSGGSGSAGDATAANQVTISAQLSALQSAIAAVSAVATSILKLFRADERITPTRYQRLEEGTSIVLTDKDATNDGQGNITLTERQ